MPSTSKHDMFKELDPNPKFNHSAPMDHLAKPGPTIPQSTSTQDAARRLSPPVMSELFKVLQQKSHDDIEEDEAEVWQYGEESFRVFATVFNGVIQSDASCLVRPRCARQVSRVILFCHKHGLDLSVKAGGYGTHGWSVAGRIVLDLSLMNSVQVGLPPSYNQDYRNLRELNWPKRSSKPTSTSTSGSGSSGSSHNGNGNGNGKGKGRAWEEGAAYYGGSGKRSLNEMYDGESMEISAGSSGNGTSRKSSHWTGSDTSRQVGHDQSDDGSRSPERRDSEASVSSVGTVNTAMGRANLVDGKLDEESKKSLISALAGPTEYSMNSSAAVGNNEFGYPISTVPGPSLNFAGSMQRQVPYGMGDRRWQFGAASIATSPTGYTNGTNPFSPTASSTSNPFASQPTYTLATFDSGATAKEVDAVTHASPFGAYHIPFAAFPVGSAVMMTGGFGFLSRLHGLSMDNLTEVEFVLADGRIVWLSRESLEDGEEYEMGKCLGVEMPDGTKGDMSDEEARDLWWAIRGAGITLGVATRYRAKAYHVPVVYAGNLIYPFDPVTTPSLIQHVRDCIKGAPRHLYTNIILTAGPMSLSGVVIIQFCYIGTQQGGAEYLSTIASWDVERCLFKDVRERSFIEQQDSIANVLKGGAGRKWFIKSDLIASLTDDVVWKTCQLFHTVPDGCTWLFELTGGAVMDCKTTCLPTDRREAQYTVAALHQWPIDIPKEDSRCVTTAVEWIDEVIHAASTGGPLPCFLQSSHPDAVRGTFGDSFDKLVEIKNRFDPTNFFKHTIWPTGSTERETGNPLMACSSQSEQGQKHAKEDSKIGMEGVEALSQMGITNMNGTNGVNGTHGLSAQLEGTATAKEEMEAMVDENKLGDEMVLDSGSRITTGVSA